MSDHSITFDQWTECELALRELQGGVESLVALSEAPIDSRTTKALSFIAAGFGGQIKRLQQQLGFKEARSDVEA